VNVYNAVKQQPLRLLKF